MSHFENLVVINNFGSSFMDYQIKLMTIQKLLCRNRYKTLLVIHTCTKFLIGLSHKLCFCILIIRKCYKAFTLMLCLQWSALFLISDMSNYDLISFSFVELQDNLILFRLVCIIYYYLHLCHNYNNNIIFYP